MPPDKKQPRTESSDTTMSDEITAEQNSSSQNLKEQIVDQSTEEGDPNVTLKDSSDDPEATAEIIDSETNDSNSRPKTRRSWYLVSETEWQNKMISLEEVSSKIHNGSSVYIGSTAATAGSILKAMTDDWNLADIRIIQMIPGGDLPHYYESHDRFRTYSFYSFAKTGGYYTQHQANGGSSGGSEGLEDYTPMSLTSIPRLLEEKQLLVDVAIIKVTPPHKGFVSLGMGVDFTKDFIKHSRLVIAEVCPHMPWTEGPSKIPISAIDWWIPVDEPLLTTEQLWPTISQTPNYPFRVLNALGRNALREIPDRATLRFGVRPIAWAAVLPFLNERKDLGLHTDVFVTPMMELHEAGVFTNKYKAIDTGRSVVSQAHGSLELYEYVDRNPVVEFHPNKYTGDPRTLAKIDNLISIVGALKVDLSGQIATDSISHKFYGGVWSDDDSIRGARFSKGGKPIVLLPSASLKGRSNIVLALPPGTGVSITRSDVEYVITEYGCAYLWGKTIRERCLALIEIAHPQYRQQLLEEAKAHNYISKSQPGKSIGTIYPSRYECIHTTKKEKQVFVRPIKPVDEEQLRNFFHRLSDHSVYLRYFRKMKSMPQRILQRTTDVDYSKDMAIVVLSPPDSPRFEIVAIGQWVSDPRIVDGTDDCPEIAFQVRDDWQGEGLGSYLFKRLIEIAKDLGVPKLKADVLADNQGMNSVFQKANTPYEKHSDFGVHTYIFDLNVEQDSE